MIKRRNGFTITELLIAASISSIIILLGTTLFIDSQKEEQRVRQTSYVTWNTMLISNLLGKVLRGAGGATIRPWDALTVEDNCGPLTDLGLPDCQGSDRITIASERTMADGSYYPKISVTSYSAVTGILQITTVDVNGNGAVDPSECALESGMINTSIILVNASDTITRTLRITNVDIATCQATTSDDLQGKILNHGVIGSETFLNGTTSPVTLKTIYWDPATFRIIKLVKIANTSPLVSADIHIYSDDVYDLQFALGYDVGFRNQSLTINGSDTDEVLYNNTADTMAKLGGLGVGGANSDLKMLLVGIIVGTSQYKASALGNSVSTLNGTVKSFPNLYLFGVERRFYLRNVLDFL
tara:strand:+ start:46738 stop:47805 length:1068 start_codon:yes stop_codon:yes gene_type:complete